MIFIAQPQWSQVSLFSVDQLIERYALLTTVVHPVVVVGLTPVGVVQPTK